MQTAFSLQKKIPAHVKTFRMCVQWGSRKPLELQQAPNDDTIVLTLLKTFPNLNV